MSKHRRHHYIAAFHLAHFTRGGEQSDQFTVVDLEKQQSWRATPRTAGHEKDFYRIESPGVDPLAVERDLFAKLEGPAATAFSSILSAARGATNLHLPQARVDHLHLYALLRFVALQRVRGPSQRAALDHMYGTLANGLLLNVAENERFFEQRRRDNPALKDMTPESMRAAVLENPVEVYADRNTQIESALRLIPRVLEGLIRRSWSLRFVPPSAPPLVCTDAPVVLLPPPQPDVPHFGLVTPLTSVVFPMTRDALLMGVLLDPPHASDELIRVGYLRPEDVPDINRTVISGAHRYVYCADEDFAILNEAGSVTGKDALFAEIRRQLARSR